ncbi:DUF1223 domain-containing protein [Roseovarius faecimaris]|uniref:DUF1223 domain-containing protein n=1 Tax=Roseovarius faecimaris TaxID=2494550 RepID=A0A6I6IRN8_9RHOB|nr:DUF1223 domain-containing protein [Roseovarius faecimaris]QGX98754.1 DUF1223 domain-containing protein [Roseovarius faecimaris]
MRQLKKFMAMALMLLLPVGAGAQEHPVVVELFTSQGCSSCPPADAYLHKLAKRDGVIALAMHVDYWDYIGWKDSFASPKMTARQRGYARTGNRRMVYTPQMIINGQDHVVGNRPKDVEELIQRHARAGAVMALSATREGNQVMVRGETLTPVKGPAVVQLIRFMPRQTVDIKRGENAGRSLSYANIVTEIRELRDWDGKGALEFSAQISGSGPGVILVQGADHGPVLAAAYIE